ncbi:fungal-specific transcription factor domain-containing protein [Exophiala viscosa]|uniref:Fungal-specific transcription factor domain-containing protein n=1 Tax=Exophiala viscosa TaxID=2486360 RepID=A0AAN6I9H4_9EURO|nr:fungal-specific transcription factor domain-containing protein [Exophiala viscosa]KAI1621030.1 fungal-specific transcription factor domain-containing protein [Exophiala viscosa]
MMDVKPKRPPRPPPRLRTKTGCKVCLSRRKKCDERRPRCGACERLHLECSYRASTSASASPEPLRKVSPVLQEEAAVVQGEQRPIGSPQSTSLSFRHSGLLTQQDWNVFHYASTRFIKLLTSPDATSEFRDATLVFAVGFDVPWVMHAALAPAALHASCADLIPKEDAILYSQSALQGLRHSLESREDLSSSKESMTFLAASIFLGLFEDFYPSASSHSLTHYQAIASVLEDQAAHMPRFDIDKLSVFHRTLLDSVLYHFSTRLIFEQEIDAICASFPSQSIAKYISALEVHAHGSRNPHTILPVLGRTPPLIFLQIYQISWLSRQPPSGDGHHHALAVQCLNELDNLEKESPVVNLGVPITKDAATHSNTDIAAKLYFLASRIFVMKIINQNICTTSPPIRALLAKGFDLLQAYDGSAPCGQYICWPILILGCAACPTSRSDFVQDFHDAEEGHLASKMRGLIQRQLLEIWKTSYSGYVRRTGGALERLWRLPSFLVGTTQAQYAPDTDIEYDGLNALIFKKGLGQVQLSAEVG